MPISLTKEQVIEQFGFDPDQRPDLEITPDQQQQRPTGRRSTSPLIDLAITGGVPITDAPAVPATGGGLPNDTQVSPSGGKASYSITQLPRDVAVGAMSAVTDIAAIPQGVRAGAIAGYDWLTGQDEFKKSLQREMMIEGGEENIKQYMEAVVRKAREDIPDMTNDDVKEFVEQYIHSKQFEDFMQTQLTAGPRIAAMWKSGLREGLGDVRPESERSWANDAGEIIGGSLLGFGGIGLKAGQQVARSAVMNSLINNIGTRAVARMAEAVTPLTIPYSGKNIAINAAAGVIIDNAIKSFKGDPSMFAGGSPDPITGNLKEDPAGVGTMATLVAATGAAAAVLGAVRGKIKMDLSQTHLGSVLPSGTVDKGLLDANQGQVALQGGPHLNIEPTPYMESGAVGNVAAASVRAQTKAVDEFATTRFIVGKIRGEQEARRIDDIFSGNTGGVLHDKAVSEAERTMKPLFEFRNSLSPEDAAKLDAYMLHTVVSENYSRLEASILDDIANVQKKMQSQWLMPSRRTQMANELAAHQDRLARLRTDTPEHRPWVQDISRAEMDATKARFEADTHPAIVAFRDAWKEASASAINKQVNAGMMTKVEAGKLLKNTPYYTPIVADPLQGKQGVGRLWLAAKQIARDFITAKPYDEGKVNPLLQSPIVRSTQDVPKTITDPRINNIADPLVTLNDYHVQNNIAIGNTIARNEANRLLFDSYKVSGQTVQSPLKAGDHARLWVYPDKNPNASPRTWFSNDQVATDATIREAIASGKYIPDWRNGFVRLIEYADKDVMAALTQMAPRWTGLMKAINETSRWFKMNTTGNFAPFFAVINAFYDSTIAMVARRPGRGFGFVTTMAHKYLPATYDQATKSYRPGVLARMVDPLSAIDITIPVQLVFYASKALWQTTRYLALPKITQELARVPGIDAFAAALGKKSFADWTDKMLTATDNTHMVTLMRSGALHSTALSAGDFGRVGVALDDLKLSKALMPANLRAAWGAYTDLLNAIHSAPKMMFYSENYAILKYKYGGIIPNHEMDRLVAETRNIAGNMTRRPGAIGMRGVDAAMPYFAQMRAGMYYVYKNTTGSPEMAATVFPRLALFTGAVAGSHLMMNNWDENSKKDWMAMPSWERYRRVIIPTFETGMAWAAGRDVPYSRDKVHVVPIAPDMAPMVAGATIGMQMMGMISSDATPRPLGLYDGTKVLLDAVIPVMPPLIQAILGIGGVKIDIQGADIRGGQWLRQVGNSFMKGPNAESQTNLGEVTQTQSLVMSALFGSNGSYLARAMDIGMHASKTHPEIGDPGVTMRENADYIEGYKRVFQTFVEQHKSRVPDVPVVGSLWSGSREKHYTSTPAWEFVTENKHHMSRIDGMRNEYYSKAKIAAREAVIKAGGIPPKVIMDATLAEMSDVVFKFRRPSGDLGKLNKEYNDLMLLKRGYEINYRLPADQRKQLVDGVIKQMQDNSQQQSMAIKWLEGELSDRYGQAIAPLLKGRELTMQTLDDMLSDSLGKPKVTAGQAATAPKSTVDMILPPPSAGR